MILLPVEQTERQTSNLTLAACELTGHKHRISEGETKLYEKDGTLYLRVFSDAATLTYEEHKAISIPQGNWMSRSQPEYEPKGWRYVAD